MKRPSGHCPTCARPISPPTSTTCPHCGAALTQGLPLAVLQIVALILAIGGVVGLLFAARLAPVPELTLAELTAAQNFAYVRVSGQLLQPPTYDASRGSLTFRLQNDDGRELSVTAYRAEAETLLASGMVPAAGDTVTVEGTLRIRDDFKSLTLANPDGLLVQRPEPQPVLIGQIAASQPGRAVTVEGSVARIRQPFEGLTLVTLADDTGVIDLALSEAAAPLLGDVVPLEEGDLVRVSGVVTLFRDTPQLTLTRADGLTILPPDALAAASPANPDGVTPIGSLIPGQPATVEGNVIAAASYSSGFRFQLDDGTGAVFLTLTDSLYRQLPAPADLRPGATVRAQGLVSFLGADLQITPAALSALNILGPGAPPDGPSTPIGQIGLRQLGETLTVEGEIVEAEPFELGLRLTVTDKSGTLVVLLWQNVLAYVPERDELLPGQHIRATGLVQQYQAVMEIVPQIGFDVELR